MNQIIDWDFIRKELIASRKIQERLKLRYGSTDDMEELIAITKNIQSSVKETIPGLKSRTIKTRKRNRTNGY